jgi:hypothetical protein
MRPDRLFAMAASLDLAVVSVGGFTATCSPRR